MRQRALVRTVIQQGLKPDLILRRMRPATHPPGGFPGRALLQNSCINSSSADLGIGDEESDGLTLQLWTVLKASLAAAMVDSISASPWAVLRKAASN